MAPGKLFGGTFDDKRSDDESDAESSEGSEQKYQAIKDGLMQSELKHIDKKQSERGKFFYVETKEDEIPDQEDWNSKYALCIVRHMNYNRKEQVDRISLQVNSEHLKRLLKETIKDFPGQSFATKDIEIDSPYRALFHYRQELEDAGKSFESDSDAAKHHRLLMDFIKEEFAEVIEECNNLLPEGRMTYHNLWAIFRPGCTVYAPVFGQPRTFTLQAYSYGCRPPSFNLSLQYVDYDGDDLGTRKAKREVFAFEGDERISSLAAFPLQWHPNPSAVKQQLLERGKRWETYVGMHTMCYKGVALEWDENKNTFVRFSIDGRVVVDTKTFHRLNTDISYSVSPFDEAAKKRRQNNDYDYDDDDEDYYSSGMDDHEPLDGEFEKKRKLKPLTDEQRMLASNVVRGFAFSEKKWLDFFVDCLAPVKWNPQCFEQLVLPEDQKDLVKSLVATHAHNTNNFDDIVKGKGRGLIMVLHGPPGVGKTLTAETVAEFTKRPLYMVSSGDLGTHSSDLDSKLSRILDMASTWKAVLLIDEADVFLERRSLHDMERNCLVSIFLRVLEYYEGILFLTSNRVNTFDDAFKSRIHVPLKYDDLTVTSRKQIWKNFLQKMQDGVDLDEAGYNSLATAHLNGRQIKNVIRTAKSLAQFHGKGLDLQKLQQVINIQMDFERELDSMNAST